MVVEILKNQIQGIDEFGKIHSIAGVRIFKQSGDGKGYHLDYKIEDVFYKTVAATGTKHRFIPLEKSKQIMLL